MFSKNQEMFGINSIQLNPGTTVRIRLKGEPWDEDEYVLTGYQHMPGEKPLAVCRRIEGGTRIVGATLWCPVDINELDKETRRRVEVEHELKLHWVADSVLDAIEDELPEICDLVEPQDNDEMFGFGSSTLSRFDEIMVCNEGEFLVGPKHLDRYLVDEHGDLKVIAIGDEPLDQRTWDTWVPTGKAVQAMDDDQVQAIKDEDAERMDCSDVEEFGDVEIPVKYIVYNHEDVVVGVYVDEEYAEAHMLDVAGRVAGWIGDEVVCTCEMTYMLREGFSLDNDLLEQLEPTGTLWTRYEEASE